MGNSFEKPTPPLAGSIEVWEYHADGSRWRRYAIAPCPFCLLTDRPHFEFALCSLSAWDREDPVPDAVHCGGCGTVGPWGRTELEAVERWNRWNATETKPLSEWKQAAKGDFDDLPF